MTRSAEVIADCGGPAAVAKRLNIRTWAVCKWRDGKVPAQRVLEIVKLANHTVGYQKWQSGMVRPDVFGI